MLLAERGPVDEPEILGDRFRSHLSRHPSLTWDEAASALDAQKNASLVYMEETGGEPYAFVCGYRLYMAGFSREAPKRRSLWARKRNLPETGVQRLAEAYGIALVSEEMYLALEGAEPLDEKTTSWILTPEDMRGQGGALFGSRR